MSLSVVRLTLFLLLVLFCTCEHAHRSTTACFNSLRFESLTIKYCSWQHGELFSLLCFTAYWSYYGGFSSTDKRINSKLRCRSLMHKALHHAWEMQENMKDLSPTLWVNCLILITQCSKSEIINPLKTLQDLKLPCAQNGLVAFLPSLSLILCLEMHLFLLLGRS